MLTTDEKIEKILENLKFDKNFIDKIEYIDQRPSKKGEYCYLEDLNPRLIQYLNKNNFKLFKHQCRVFELVKDGKNVIITTPTASGKTLAFNLPILDTLAEDKNATALYIYPAKALSSDQLLKIKEYEKETQIKINPHKYDKDIDSVERALARLEARIIITNPHMIHQTLFWHFQWCRFYSNLKYIVIDEAHKYRGVFGSNVALLIKRLMRICNYYGSNPQFILSSATLANPVEFSEKLIGKKVELVDKDYSNKGEKTFVFFNPFNVKDHSILFDTRDLISMFVLNDIQTLCFSRTRNMAETISSKVKEYLKDKNKDIYNSIAPYRAQYPVKERREIESGLKNRKYLGVISTNALELGIDIGSLDAVIISGYPGTLISTWQQLGRAGRGNNSSIAVLMGTNDPLNQFIMKNPNYVLKGSNENATLDLDNEKIIANHLIFAASELPLSDNDFNFFNVNESAMDKAIALGLHKGIYGWEYTKIGNNGPDNPSVDIPLQQIAVEEFKIIYNRKVLESLNREDAYLISFKGATRPYQGNTYIVKNFDHHNKKIFVEKQNIEFRKNSEKRIDLNIIRVIKTEKIGFLDLYYGELELIIDFYKFEYDKKRKINYEKIDVPTLKFKTKGIWFNIPDSTLNDLEKLSKDPEIVKYSISGAENLLSTMLPLKVLCDRCDIGTFSTDFHPYTNTATIFIYDSYEGGIGLSEKCVDIFGDLTKIALNLVKKCGCKRGCGLCIYSFSCGAKIKPAHKKGSVLLLNKLLNEMGEKEIIDITTEFDSNEIFRLIEEGLSFEYNGDHHKAIKSYDSALKLDPQNSLALYNKGVSHLNLEDYNEVIKCAVNCIEINLKDFNAWYLLGASFHYLEEYQTAMYCYNRVLEFFPDHEEVKECINILKKCNQDENYEISEEHQEIVNTLQYSLLGKKRADAAYKLGKTKNPYFVNVLCDALNDEDGNVRRLAASALGKIKDPKAVDSLIDLLNDEKPQVRQYAVKALSKINDPRALPYLEKIENDPVYYVVKAVQIAIKNIKS